MNVFDSIIQRIIKAKEEAVKNNINANKIVISDNIAICKGFGLLEEIGTENNTISKNICYIKPMILGLEVEVIPKNEMPDKVDFIVLHDETKEEQIREQERKKMKEQLRRMDIIEIIKFLQED